MNQDEIKIAIADDHTLFRNGLKSIFKNYPHLKVVVEASDGKELTEEKKLDNVDVVVLDINMPNMDGFQAIEVLKERDPSLKVIILSMHDSPKLILKMIKAGANSYLLKSTNAVDLVAAIENVVEHTYHFNDLVSRAMQSEIRKENSDEDINFDLNKVELEIIKLVANGLTNSEIGKLMKMSQRTIEAYRNKIIKKLEVNNSAQMVAKVLKSGIIPLD